MAESSVAAAPYDRWTLFAGLWGWALLMHQATFDKWRYSPLGWALVALAVALVLKPRSVRLLMATVRATRCTLSSVCRKRPTTCYSRGSCALPGAWLRPALWSAAPRRRALGQALRAGSGGRHPLEGSLVPLKVGLLLVYWMSVLHKLNYDFVDPETSCASYMYRRVAEALPFLPRAVWAEHVAIWSTLLAEAAVPVLLLLARTWQLGLVAALSFHLMLGFDPTPGIYSFTGLLYALFVLVLPQSFVDSASQRL